MAGFKSFYLPQIGGEVDRKSTVMGPDVRVMQSTHIA